MGAPAPLVLAVVAHPDDESYGLGGTIAWLSARGARVHLVIATRGEAGSIADPALDTPAIRCNLAAIREQEARAAAAELGVTAIEFLGQPDGQLAEIAESTLSHRLAAIIRQLRPMAVMTFGPDGIYGHPDHVAISQATTAAVQVAADPGTRIGDLPPHTVARLFYQVLSDAEAERLNAEYGPIQLGEKRLPFIGYPAAAITTRVDVTPVLERKLAAIAQHRSQVAAEETDLERWLEQGPVVECFILAQRTVPDADGLAHDPLAGLWPPAIVVSGPTQHAADTPSPGGPLATGKPASGRQT